MLIRASLPWPVSSQSGTERLTCWMGLKRSVVWRGKRRDCISHTTPFSSFQGCAMPGRIARGSQARICMPRNRLSLKAQPTERPVGSHISSSPRRIIKPHENDASLKLWMLWWRRPNSSILQRIARAGETEPVGTCCGNANP